jgi:hypothetical protein
MDDLATLRYTNKLLVEEVFAARRLQRLAKVINKFAEAGVQPVPAVAGDSIEALQAENARLAEQKTQLLAQSGYCDTSDPILSLIAQAKLILEDCNAAAKSLSEEVVQTLPPKPKRRSRGGRRGRRGRSSSGEKSVEGTDVATEPSAPVAPVVEPVVA